MNQADLFTAAFEHHPSAHAVLVFEVKNINLVAANAAFKNLLGLDEKSPKELGTKLGALVSDGFKQALLTQSEFESSSAIVIDGEKKQLQLSLIPLGVNRHFLLVLKSQQEDLQDKQRMIELMSANDKLMAKIDDLSKTDPRTGIYNSKAINHELSILFNSAKRNYGSFSILFVSFNGMGKILKDYGEEVLDKALEHFASMLNKNFRRRSDIIIRYDEHQFLVCFAGANEAQTYNLADKILHSITNMPMVLDSVDNKINLTMSIGMLSMVLSLDSNLDHVIGAAHLAANDAKKAGENQIHVVDAESLEP